MHTCLNKRVTLTELLSCLQVRSLNAGSSEPSSEKAAAQSRVTCTANQAVEPLFIPPGRSRGTHESIVKLREAPRKRAPCATARRAVQEGSLLGSWEPGEMAYVLSGLCCWLLHHRNCMRCCSIAMEVTCEKRVGVSTVCEPQFNFNFLGSSW